MTDRNQRIL